MRPEETACAIATRVSAAPFQAKRRLVALVGPPASGKSTLAELVAANTPGSCVLPMDGFHLDDRILEARGLLARKGAPETFDTGGLFHTLRRLQTEEEVFFPIFERSQEQSIAGAGVVGPSTQTVIVEGNYLLFDAPGWRALSDLWDFSAVLNVPEHILRERLMARWADYGYSAEDAAKKTDMNDLPNARAVIGNTMPADMLIDNM